MTYPPRKNIPWQVKAYLYRKQDGKCTCGEDLAIFTPRAVHADSSHPNRLWSPTDLTVFAESPWVSWLERLARDSPSHPLVAEADARRMLKTKTERARQVQRNRAEIAAALDG